jgi:type I restriction enzyme, S subunit
VSENAHWVEKTLAEVCEITSKLIDPREPEFLDLKHVGAGNIISKTGELIDVQTAREEGLKSGKFVFDESMVLYSKIRPYLMKVVRPDFVGLCSADIYPLSPIQPEVSADFLFYLLLTEDFTDYAVKGSARAGMPKVNRTHLFKYRAWFPPLPEQERIVAILDEAFEAIDTAIANTEKNLANARELFESYLIAAIRTINDTSALFTLEEIASDFGRGKSKHRPRNDKTLYGGKYPFVQTGDVRAADHVLHTFSQSYNEKGLAQSKLWPKGTVCITIAANIAETAILGMNACFPDSVIGVVPNPEYATHDYVEYLLQGFSAELKAEGEGTAQDNINMGTFKDRKFPFPSANDQLACVNRLDSVRSSVRQLQEKLGTKLTNLQELKQSILQKAFSGELTASADPMLQEARL